MKTERKHYHLESISPIPFDLHWGMELIERGSNVWVGHAFYFLLIKDNDYRESNFKLIKGTGEGKVKDKHDIEMDAALWVGDVLARKVLYRFRSIYLDEFNPLGFSKEDYLRISKNVETSGLREKLENFADSAESGPPAGVDI